MGSEAFVCDAVRTPIGRYGGALAGVRADDLAAVPIAALRERNPKVDWERLDDVVFGCANQAGEDNRNVARMASLLAGLPVQVPGATVNRLCGSGLEAVAAASRAIKAGDGAFYIAGGVESMSRAPFVIPKADTAFARESEIHDTTIGWRFVNPRMQERYGVDPLGETAENVAAEYGISRTDQDAFALRSQVRAARAQQSGRFAEEIVPVKARRGKDLVEITQDEHPRPATTIEQLTKLRPAFRKDGTVTAGNSSGVNDGAAAIIIASEKAVKEIGLTPRARVVAVASSGVEPRVMGIGPVPATRKLLDLLKLSMDDMDIIELNEAFAAQALAVLRQLQLPDDAEHVNPNGGAVALGHPLGMSGARLVLTAVRELERRQAHRALCTMCIGVGQGIAAIVEKV
jgi:3-oxo-5,6-didehydrosuberyl-CoA/3-oxoadipyl-CoA thiolase